MSCLGCAKKFTPFRCAVGCPGCGFTYCKSCLDNKIFVEKYNKEKKVCYKCKVAKENMDKGINMDSNVVEPPKAYLKRMENLENPSRPPITMYQMNSDKIRRLKEGLSPADQEIADRLEKLKEDKKSAIIPTDNEIKERLAKLRDEQFTTSSSKSNLPTVDNRTDQQKSDDLINQLMSECEIDDNRAKVDSDIRERLDKLKDVSTSKDVKNVEMRDLTDEEMVLKVIQEAMLSKDDKDEDELLSNNSVEEKSDEITTSDDHMSDDDL